MTGFSRQPDTSTSESDGLLLTVEEAAQRLRLGRTLVYQLITTGQLESVKVGRLRRIPAECLPDYITNLRSQTAPNSAGSHHAA